MPPNTPTDIEPSPRDKALKSLKGQWLDDLDAHFAHILLTGVSDVLIALTSDYPSMFKV